MKIFIDTANVEEIKEASTWGILSGCTTNPSLIAKEGRDLKEVIQEITSLVDGPISAEVNEGDLDSMEKEAIELSKLHKNIVIKVPMTKDGISLTKRLSNKGIKTNVTLVFSVPQALLAFEAGATFVSPFMGRIDDMNESGAALIAKLAEVKNIYGYETEIIAASIRNTKHIEEAALAGADIATIPFGVLKKAFDHPLTTNGLKIFKEASKK